jgi:hypothetical protein
MHQCVSTAVMACMGTVHVSVYMRWCGKVHQIWFDNLNFNNFKFFFYRVSNIEPVSLRHTAKLVLIKLIGSSRPIKYHLDVFFLMVMLTSTIAPVLNTRWIPKYTCCICKSGCLFLFLSSLSVTCLTLFMLSCHMSFALKSSRLFVAARLVIYP